MHGEQNIKIFNYIYIYIYNVVDALVELCSVFYKTKRIHIARRSGTYTI